MLKGDWRKMFLGGSFTQHFIPVVLHGADAHVQMSYAIVDMEAPLSTHTFSCAFCGGHVQVNLTIRQSHEATMEFTVGGMAYTFNIVRWGRRGFSRFLGCFFEHTPRDPERFGTYSEDEEGQPSINMNIT